MYNRYESSYGNNVSEKTFRGYRVWDSAQKMKKSSRWMLISDIMFLIAAFCFKKAAESGTFEDPEPLEKLAKFVFIIMPITAIASLITYFRYSGIESHASRTMLSIKSNGFSGVFYNLPDTSSERTELSFNCTEYISAHTIPEKPYKGFNIAIETTRGVLYCYAIDSCHSAVSLLDKNMKSAVARQTSFYNGGNNFQNNAEQPYSNYSNYRV